EGYILPDFCIAPLILRRVEVASESGKVRRIVVKRDEGVAIVVVQASECLNQVADVGSDAEVAQAAAVDHDVLRHWCFYRYAAGVSLQAYSGKRSVRFFTSRRTSALT